MKFDWYQATIEDNPIAVLDQVKKLGNEVRSADSSARRWRYRQGWEVLHETRGTVALVMCGGNGDKPHAIATGEAAAAFSEVIRDHWLDRHLVTRCDAAEDFNEAGAYVRLRRAARKIAKANRLAFPQVSDPLNPKAGRTQYVGSPASDYRARIYEKGWEQFGKLSALFRKQGFDIQNQEVPFIVNESTGELVRPEDWTREELQVRPKQEEARRLVASLSPEQCWGVSPWAQELAAVTMALDLERIVMRTKKVSKDEEALRWMCQQYSGPLVRLYQDKGSWERMGQELGKLIEQQRCLP
jgi:DNA relaxase NicK